MDAVSAKEFLISRVIQQANSEHVPLSEVEKKMLHFTEVHPTLPDIYDINAEFERDYNSDEYETKIAHLLKNARLRDGEESPAREREWKDALDALKKEDHYILVMVGQAFEFGPASGGEHRVRDLLIYVLAGIGIVLFIFLKAFLKGRR